MDGADAPATAGPAGSPTLLNLSAQKMNRHSFHTSRLAAPRKEARRSEPLHLSTTPHWSYISLTSQDPPALAPGVSPLSALVARLVAAPIPDLRFTTTFLCLYRFFATPSELLREIIASFHREAGPYLLRLDAQWRHLEILSTWIHEYPGDLAHPTSRAPLYTFLDTLSAIPALIAGVAQLQNSIAGLKTDDDTYWARADAVRPARDRATTPPADPTASTPLTKSHWQLLLDTPADDIAAELTRIDWNHYAAIRRRDFIREEQIGPIRRMVEQFNYTSFWATNLILLRDKAKHRARALEKLMDVGWRLRQLNNYNTLGAIVAGASSSVVQRLVQTCELVSASTQKQFMSLQVLMGMQRSHAAYRLAWENSPAPRIPFIPLHRRDLVASETANPTFREDGQVNWGKFEVLGDILAAMQCQTETPYDLPPTRPEIQRLVQGASFTDDPEELYGRSLEVERTAQAEPPRRRLWGR